MRDGPVVLAYDGTAGAEHAIREAGELLAGRAALVVVVYKAGIGFELLETPTAALGLPPATLDIRTAMEVDRALAERSQRLAQQGAGIAREAGFPEAEGHAVADDIDTPVAETLVREADQRNAQAIVVGTHGHRGIGEIVLGSTTRDVLRRSHCPVVAVREPERR
jgi:nucleotide-binding universal stress UspA family protein